MKITRIARGYRLRLTDGEMMALHTALGMVRNRLAKGEINGVCRAAGLRVNRPLRAFLEARGLRVDQDLRPVLKPERKRKVSVERAQQAVWNGKTTEGL